MENVNYEASFKYAEVYISKLEELLIEANRRASRLATDLVFMNAELSALKEKLNENNSGNTEEDKPNS